MPGEQDNLLIGHRIIYPNSYTTRHRETSAIGRISTITCYAAFTEPRFGPVGEMPLCVILGESVK